MVIMIPDNMSLSSDEANDGIKQTSTSEATDSSCNLSNRPQSSSTTTVSAINSNTFVVKLKPALESNALPSEDTLRLGPKANLLQLFCENSKRKNVSVVKALGLGKIVVNRTLLKKNKKSSTPLSASSNAIPATLSSPSAKITRNVFPKNGKTISVSISTTMGGARLADGRMVKLGNGATERRSLLHTQAQALGISSEKENRNEDDLGGNLASLMNFKLSSLVPKQIKTGLDNGETYTIKTSIPGMNKTASPINADAKNESKFSHANHSPLQPKNEKAKTKSESNDDDLTSLSWLTVNNKNLIKTLRSCNPDDAGISLSGDESEEDDELISMSTHNKAVFTAKSKVDGSAQDGYGHRQYDQTYNPNGKPPYSFSCLIFMAVEDSYEKKLPVKEIYAWVCKHFPYFLTAPSGWKNSIRHNLSLNKCFKKADQGKHSQEPGKGSLWCIDPAYRPNLIQALKRTPFYPYLYPGGIGQPLSLNNLASLLPGVRSGRIPLWSPTLSSSSNSAWADPDVASAALNLMGLKGNDAIDKQPQNVKSTIQELAKEIFDRRKWSRKRSMSSSSQESIGTVPLVITDPSEDHTYSTSSMKLTEDITGDLVIDDRCVTPESEKSAPDAAYEFETCGTDLESEVGEDHFNSVDSGGGILSDRNDTASDCELADSGFVGLRRSRKPAKAKATEVRPARKRKSSSSTPPSRIAKRTRRSDSKPANQSKRSPHAKGTLKVRFQNKKSIKGSTSKSKKNKKDHAKSDTCLSSDADSGKDSPKVFKKSRSHVSSEKLSNCYSKTYNTKRIPSSPFKTFSSSPYGTRSATQPRHSKRIMADKKSTQKGRTRRLSSRRLRQDSGCNDTEEEEEIKLAAGSLLHLAGIRSPSSSVSNT